MLRSFVLLLIVLKWFTNAAPSNNGPLVETALGKIRGIFKEHAGKTVRAFLGVPYAKPPVGDLRFQPPQPITEPWRELNAQNLAKSCYQTPDTYFPGFRGSEMWNAPTELSEDCLNMNIWVPENPDGTVLVWIFGGGFFSGSPSLDLYDGTVLAATTGATVVNINYRLGPFGFLYLGKGSKAPGNMGLLDQQAALKWIHENIGFFGGDPSQVTLIGESAGAASATAHLSAPDSYPYFSKVVANSGSIIHPWATRPAEIMLQLSMNLAKKLGCPPDGANADSIHACLVKASAKDIQTQNDAIWEEVGQIMSFPFVPILDDENFFKGILPDSLNDRNMKKDASVIIGAVKDEGTFWLPYYLSGSGFTFNETVDANSEVNSAFLDEQQYKDSVNSFISYFGNSSKAEEILQNAYKDVSPEKELKLRLRDGVAQLMGDAFFTCSVKEYADVLGNNLEGKVYTYYFTRRSSANPWPKWMGVMHGYEIEYEFGLPFRNSSLYDENQLADEQKVSKHFMDLISSFAKTGTPANYWPPYIGNGGKWLVIDASSSTGDAHKLTQDVHSKGCSAINQAKEAALEYYKTRES
uniref:Carboxylic ester hydrolase n=2 Tax=Heligmosomoides polygyrus TaxID=6339 RepID=F6LW95_HELBE|nr:acetylcholinesterase-3 [Heligmosomoides bakeri]